MAVFQVVLLSAASMLGFCWKVLRHTREDGNKLTKATLELEACQTALAHERKLRLAERTGRIRADKERRKAELALLQRGDTATHTASNEQQHAESSAEDDDDVAAADSKASMEGHENETMPSGASTVSKTTPAAVDSNIAVTGRQAEHQRQYARQLKRIGAPQLPITYPLKPIGHIQSCFSQRNGTPRQPLLAPMARGRLVLAPDVPLQSLDGLEGYSHVWILYLFHENTDLAKALSPDRRQDFKAKIRVPRLNGGKMGILATRSPHRPVPIGLSVAQVLSVSKGTVLLGGADIVDGSPVLDIKPYVPFCDSVADATAPDWVKVEATDEPLAVSMVHMPPAAVEEVERCWRNLHKAGRSLYDSGPEFMQLVQEVLSRDIRSLHQRLSNTAPQVPPGHAGGSSTVDANSRRPISSTSTSSSRNGSQKGTKDNASSSLSNLYHVVLEGIDIAYSISASGEVLLHGAQPFNKQLLHDGAESEALQGVEDNDM